MSSNEESQTDNRESHMWVHRGMDTKHGNVSSKMEIMRGPVAAELTIGLRKFSEAY